ncbi:hypothetical protein N0V88_004497 [Collariella sp. IMI 366227]|nr:hypothetical protein N0V88_004497 [Collariella sp. IMI 366227]
MAVDNFLDICDILGQQPFLNVYTQLSLIFPIADPSLHRIIIKTLRDGLSRLAELLPWVAGQVTFDSGSSEFRVAPLGVAPSLIIRDLRDDESAPTFKDLRQARFPFRMLNEKLVAPEMTIPGRPNPVFAVQANFITGGLILTFVGHHQTMDLVGQRRVMSLLSRLCRGEQLTDAEILDANPTRRGRIPLLEDSCSPAQEDDCRYLKPDPVHNPLVPARWEYFAFSAESLAALKRAALENANSPPGFVSTNDSLTAFLWQSVARVRLLRLRPDTNSPLGRAVDLRRYLGFPPTYPGMVQTLTYHSHTLQELADMPLGTIASQLRLAVDPSTAELAYTARTLATMIERSNHKIPNCGTPETTTGLAISSWADPGFYTMNFGLALGNPEAVRRPAFTEVQSLVYLMPKTPEGEIMVGLCLREDDVANLRADHDFAGHSTFIG